MWVLERDPGGQHTLGIVNFNFVPASGGRSASAWPLKTTSSTPSPTRFVPCPPPATPTP
ncbi:MAG TPA: hypothetical protein VKR56_14035 [Candidatus Cybelea sp.]|nr:hypothetical protein [Candidatus Cybelea sp.]